MSCIPQDPEVAQLLFQVVNEIEQRLGIVPTPSTQTPSWIFAGNNTETGREVRVYVTIQSHYDVKVKIVGWLDYVAMHAGNEWTISRQRLHSYLDGLLEF